MDRASTSGRRAAGKEDAERAARARVAVIDLKGSFLALEGSERQIISPQAKVYKLCLIICIRQFFSMISIK